MPQYSEATELASRPRRVLVAGTSGSGKTTLAVRIAELLQVPHIEIDGLYHGADWIPRPEFDADVQALIEKPGWVTEWQYRQVRSRLAQAADLLVWLDLPRALVMWQITRRTLRRRIRRERLWNANVEPPLLTFFTDPTHVVRWAWSSHSATAAKIEAVLADRPGLVVVCLRSHAAARRWVTGPLADSCRVDGGSAFDTGL